MKPSELRVQVDRSQLAPAGIHGDLLVVTTAQGESTEGKLNDRCEREFEVHCVFSRDAGFGREPDPVLSPELGSSFFRALHGPNGQFIIRAPSGDFRFVNNTAGEFSGVTWTGRAQSPENARTIFLAGISPVLDHFAYLADTPLIVANVVARDIKHDVIRSSYVSPYEDKSVSIGTGRIFSELAAIYALYRESKSSLSPFYRFLCLYKILEGVFGFLRPAAYQRAQARQVKLTPSKEIIPEDRELRKVSPELIGKPIKVFMDNELQPRFRNAVAHFLLDSGRPLNPSDPVIAAEFHNVMLAVELACRVVIEGHEHILAQLEREGA